MENKLKVIQMSDVAVEEVNWVWYPYIPYGKITIVQGDPGEGKTTFILSLMALLTTGDPLPEEDVRAEPINVIYQTAEDGLGDTIKPRLLATKANCEKVLVIDESQQELTLSDERLEKAIRMTKAKVVVLDPIQAYLGSDVDMHRANEIRPIMKRLAMLAERTGCAIILIGHMNKAQGTKSAYRGLGSIDFRASARSVLVVGRLKNDPDTRIVAHDKSSLSPVGQSIMFELSEQNGFVWKGFCDITVDDLLSGKGEAKNKTEIMMEELQMMLTEPMSAEDVFSHAEGMNISKRTLMKAKQNLGIASERMNGQWYWRLADQGCKDVVS